MTEDTTKPGIDERIRWGQRGPGWTQGVASRNHDRRFWAAHHWQGPEAQNPEPSTTYAWAVVDDFGNLVPVSWPAPWWWSIPQPSRAHAHFVASRPIE